MLQKTFEFDFHAEPLEVGRVTSRKRRALSLSHNQASYTACKTKTGAPGPGKWFVWRRGLRYKTMSIKQILVAIAYTAGWRYDHPLNEKYSY